MSLLRPQSAKESARVLPRRWIEEEWGDVLCGGVNQAGGSRLPPPSSYQPSSCSQVVGCAGSDQGALLRGEGLPLPKAPIRGTSITSTPDAGYPPTSLNCLFDASPSGPEAVMDAADSMGPNCRDCCDVDIDHTAGTKAPVAGRCSPVAGHPLSAWSLSFAVFVVLFFTAGVASQDSWGKGGARFAPAHGPWLEPAQSSRLLTRPRWPSPAVEASVLRYLKHMEDAKALERDERARDGFRPSSALQGTRGAEKLLPHDTTLPTEAKVVAWSEYEAIRSGDVIITVEHCHDCRAHHGGMARHDPQAYLRHALAVKELLVEKLRAFPIRLAVLLKPADLRSKSKYLGAGGRVRGGRVGAFEIQVAAARGSEGGEVCSRVIHSKLVSGRWPSLEDTYLPVRVEGALAAWGLRTRSTTSVSEVDQFDGAAATVEAGSCRGGPGGFEGDDAERLGGHVGPGYWEFDHRQAQAFPRGAGAAEDGGAEAEEVENARVVGTEALVVSTDEEPFRREDGDLLHEASDGDELSRGAMERGTVKLAGLAAGLSSPESAKGPEASPLVEDSITPQRGPRTSSINREGEQSTRVEAETGARLQGHRRLGTELSVPAGERAVGVERYTTGGLGDRESGDVQGRQDEHSPDTRHEALLNRCGGHQPRGDDLHCQDRVSGDAVLPTERDCSVTGPGPDAPEAKALPEGSKTPLVARCVPQRGQRAPLLPSRAGDTFEPARGQAGGFEVVADKADLPPTARGIEYSAGWDSERTPMLSKGIGVSAPSHDYTPPASSTPSHKDSRDAGVATETSDEVVSSDSGASFERRKVSIFTGFEGFLGDRRSVSTTGTSHPMSDSDAGSSSGEDHGTRGETQRPGATPAVQSGTSPASPDLPLASSENTRPLGVAGDRFEWGRGKRFASVLAGEDPPHEEGRGRNRSDGGLAGEGATAMSSPYPRFHGDPDPPWAPGESEMGPEAMEDEEYASDFAQDSNEGEGENADQRVGRVPEIAGHVQRPPPRLGGEQQPEILEELPGGLNDVRLLEAGQEEAAPAAETTDEEEEEEEYGDDFDADEESDFCAATDP